MDSTIAPGEEAPATIDRDAIAAAAARIGGDIRHTPLWRLPGAAVGVDGVDIALKLEQFQVGGSFKARGMFNRMRSLPVPPAGVVVASGGNAAIAVAAAARALGVACEVFVPEVSSATKRRAIAALGATVTVHGAAYADAYAACIERQRRSGALLMHAYDQPEVVAGAGTIGAEIESDGGVPDRVVVAVGGGGLVAGIAAWFAGGCVVDAVEPARAPTLHAALAAGRPVNVDVGGIAADSLGARRIGGIAWEVCRRHGVASTLVDDGAIVDAQRALWRDLRIAVEPAAAVPLAALRSRAIVPARGERVVVVVCGANVDPATLAGPGTVPTSGPPSAPVQ